MFDQFKPIMQNGERYVVVEDGRPQYVLMRFHDYVLLLASQPGAARRTPTMVAAAPQSFDALNVELADVAPAIGDVAEFGNVGVAGDPPPTLPTGDTTIRLEDLPL